MSDFAGPVKSSVVKIRIVKSAREFWYADKVGQTVEALKEVSVQDGREYVSYKQWPRPRGFEPSGHYVTLDVEEVA